MSSFPILFVWFLIAIFIFRHHMRKNSKLQEEVSNKFWSKERASLVVRKKNLEDRDYIKPSLEPSVFKEEGYYAARNLPELERKQKQIKSLVQMQMVNFSHLSNTELRLQYGTATLTTIEALEENYNQYIKALFVMGKNLYEVGDISLSKTYLEEGIDVGTDIRDHYLLLATIYQSEHNTTGIEKLLKQAKDLQSLTKDSLVKALEAML